MLHSVYLDLILSIVEEYKGIYHDALSKSFVTSYYLFLFYCSYEITSYATQKNSLASVAYMTFILYKSDFIVCARRVYVVRDDTIYQTFTSFHL